MTNQRKLLWEIGSIVSLSFWFFMTFASPLRAEEKTMTFQEFHSSCIDLGHYDAKTKDLTVRFVNRNTERFYRYLNVPSVVWKKLKILNETGGVGEYLNDTIVRHPENYPFKELTIRSFKTAPTKKKAGNSR
jgi:hypothetical protein